MNAKRFLRKHPEHFGLGKAQRDRFAFVVSRSRNDDSNVDENNAKL